MTELQTSQEDCQIIFEGPYKEESIASKTLLVLMWLGHQVSMTLKSLDGEKGSYKKFLEVLKKIFWPEASDTMSHFRF